MCESRRNSNRINTFICLSSFTNIQRFSEKTQRGATSALYAPLIPYMYIYNSINDDIYCQKFKLEIKLPNLHLKDKGSVCRDAEIIITKTVFIQKNNLTAWNKYGKISDC